MFINDFSKVTPTKVRVLAAIRHFNIITIKDISNHCDLSIPIVTRYVDDLLRDGVLKEHITPTTTIGRKPKQYSLNANYGYIIGVELGLFAMAKIGLFKFDGTLVSNYSLDFVDGWGPRETIDKVIEGVEVQLESHSIDKTQILFIVIGNPGIVNPHTGTMESAAMFAHWNKLPLYHIFHEYFNAPVKVMNDINLSAIGEKEYGIGQGYNNFVFVRQSAGIKAGIILKNRLYQGEEHAAGEIGDSILPIIEDGQIAHKKAESFLSLPAICQQIADKLEDNPTDIFYAITGSEPQKVTIDNIVSVLGKQSYVNDHIIQAGKMLGYVLVNAVATLDIPLVILSGDATKFSNYYFKPIREVLGEYLPYPPNVVISSLGNDVALYGAFAVGQDNVLEMIP
jgi:predicted NBD/HSP70 family sugar kinase